ncbi:hypothetical protein E3N88_07886 [Mikania micrantha]|uniref:ATP-dependent DNA helicase n=1 Tax=Mikania micrantha TaxID=192012 RepID=A0A5N6PGN5_9ASTR|nr:hypothetical protein E3N88_07886 [Mikania micrantha]
MNDRKCFESVDKSLKDLLDDCNKPFGGKSILLGDDFRQTLPIKPKASKTTILSLSLPRSYLWRKIAINKTKKIMSFKHISDISAGDSPEPLEIQVLKKWVPFVGKTEKKPEICYLFVDMHGHAIEAVADLSREKIFDSIIDVGSCYTVNNYVAIQCRSYMPAMPHQASLRIGKRATFTPLLNENLPPHYYNFATYTDLPTRMEFPKRLTGFPFIDYIGRVEDVSRIMVREEKTLRKISIQDDRRNHIEITLWGEKAKSPGIEDAVGSVLAVSSTTVTEFKGVLQLESTSATTVAINPAIPELQMFKDLGEPSRQQTIDKYVTIAELKATVTGDNLQARLACFATIVEIQTNRNWFYVTCSEPACPHKAYPQSNTYVCEDHGILSQPMFISVLTPATPDPKRHMHAFAEEKLQSHPFAEESRTFSDDIPASSYPVESLEQDTGIVMFTLPESSDEYHTPPYHQSCSETSSIEGQIPPPTNTSAFDAGDGDLLPVDDDGESHEQRVVNLPNPSDNLGFSEKGPRSKRSRGGGEEEEDHEDDIDFLETAMRRGLTLPRPRWWPAEGFKD